MNDRGYSGWRLSNSGVTVVPPKTDGDAAVNALVVHTEHAPTMAPPLVVATAYARPYLSIVPRDEIAAAVERIDAKLEEPATMATYPPAVPGGKFLFRYVRADAEELVALAIPAALLTPHVRALWWELAEAVEAVRRTLA